MSCLSVSCKWIKTCYILITWFNVQNNSLRLALVLINISDLDLANCPSSVNIRVSKYGWFNIMPTLFWSFYIFLSCLLYSWDRLKNRSLPDLHDSLFGTASSKRSFVQCYRGPYTHFFSPRNNHWNLYKNQCYVYWTWPKYISRG